MTGSLCWEEQEWVVAEEGPGTLHGVKMFQCGWRTSVDARAEICQPLWSIYAGYQFIASQFHKQLSLLC